MEVEVDLAKIERLVEDAEALWRAYQEKNGLNVHMFVLMGAVRDLKEYLNLDATTGLTYEERKRLCHATVTLNDKPAKIGGAQRKFARVTVVETGEAHEWAWQSAQNIVERGGNFKYDLG